MVSSGELKSAGMLNNREISTVAWLAIAIIWLLRKPAVASSLGRLLRALSNRYILTGIGLMLLYVVLVVAVLSNFGLWLPRHLKDTALWTISGAAVAVFRSQGAIDDPYFVSDALKDNLKILVVLEFILNLCVFSLPIEMIAVPALAVLGAVYGYTRENEEYLSVANVLEVLLGVYLVFLILYSFRCIYLDFGSFATADTVMDFLLLPSLALLFLPFTYFVVLYMAYERAFQRIESAVDDRLAGYARRLSFLHFRADRILLVRWASIIARFDIKDKEALLETIRKVKKMKLTERCPPEVNFADGWSPHHARFFLSDRGLRAKYYEPMYGELWLAVSEPLVLDQQSTVLGNSVRYTIEGTESHAKRLKLVLTINDPAGSNLALRLFLESCAALSLAALGVELPADLEHAVLNGASFQGRARKREVTVSRRQWGGDQSDGYEVTFEIRHPSYRSDR